MSGSTAVAVVLLLVGILFLVLAPIIGIVLLLSWGGYNVWRLASKADACPSCRKPGTMLSVNSPRGRKLAVEFGVVAATTQSGSANA
jgi:hypothetical protein